MQPIFRLLALGSRWVCGDLRCVREAFSDTNMLISAAQKSRIGGITQREDPMRRGLRCGGI